MYGLRCLVLLSLLGNGLALSPNARWHGSARLVPSARCAASAVAVALPKERSWLARGLLGDERRTPIRSSLKREVMKKTVGMIPEDAIDTAVAVTLQLVEEAVPGGLDKLLSPGELQKQKVKLQADLGKRLAASIDTPLGDAAEQKLGTLIVGALFDSLTTSELLSPADERMIILERKLADVKAEMGLLWLSRVRLARVLRSTVVRAASFLVVAASSVLFGLDVLGHLKLVAPARLKQLVVAQLAAWALLLMGWLAK